MRLTIENLPPGSVGESIEDIDFLLRNTDTNIVSLCLDTGHAGVGANKPPEYVEAFCGRLTAVHWHDCHEGQDAHRFPGMGDIHWQEFFDTLQKCGSEPRFVLEAIPTNGYTLRDGIQEIEQAIKELRPPNFE